MKKVFLVLLVLIGVGSAAIGVGFFLRHKTPLSMMTPPPAKELPLLKYTIENLHNQTYTGSTITIEKLVKVEPTFVTFIFSYQTLNKKMTGLMNVPLSSGESATGSAAPYPVLVMVRGFIPAEGYQSGDDTRSPGEFFAEHGYITLAPDFFGFGGSDPESSDVWEARFQKPINVVDLLKTAQLQTSITVPAQLTSANSQVPAEIHLNTQKVGMWAHSNGGQIALTALEILSQPIPTTLWAPVTAPFPYSVLYFSDEEADEGKATRKFIAQFDQDYDALQFSLSQHLNLLTGPLQLQQGVADQNIHYVWSDEFVAKINNETARRKDVTQQIATEGASVAPANELLTPIQITYFKYPNSNHDMQPDWSMVINRDLVYFDKYLK